MKASIAVVVWLTVLSALFAACSAGNREGPDVTCEDLACGRINACEEGIIAQCVDGIVVRFHVCTDDTVCEREWQEPGAYTCAETDTDCEGCRPERVEGCAWLDPNAEMGGTDGAGGDGSGGAATSTAQ